MLGQQLLCNTEHVIGEVVAEDSCQMQVTTTLRIHADDPIAKLICHFQKELFPTLALDEKGNRTHIDKAPLGKGLQRIQNSPATLRQHTHGHTASRMNHQPWDIAYLLCHACYGTIRNSYDIQIGILRDRHSTAAPANTDHPMACLL